MAKFGVLFVGFNTEDLVHQSIAPWIAAREIKLGGHEYVICAISLPFAGFPNDSEDNTTNILRQYRDEGKIDYLVTEPRNIPETAARSMGLRFLKERGVTHSWQADSDEMITVENIKAIADYVARDEWTTWWRLSLKNYVGDDKHYLVDPFQPSRIHRINAGAYVAHSFSQDNDICYGGGITRDLKPQEAFSSKTISKEIAWIRHATWGNDLRSKKKIEYQRLRWGCCSFRWNDELNRLEWDEAYYAARGECIPMVCVEPSQ